MAHHRQWLQKETDGQIQVYPQIAEHRKNYLDFLHLQSHVNINVYSELEEHRLEKRTRRVNKIQSWISNCSSLVDACGGMTRTQPKVSCDWFLKMPAYCNWKNESFCRSKVNNRDDLNAAWQHHVLFVQGMSTSYISYRVLLC